MFGIKRKGREMSAKLHKAIQVNLSPIIQKYSDRFKIQRKIRIANIWARKHPKKFMLNYVAFAVLLLGITLYADFSFSKRDEDAFDLKSIPSFSHRLQSLNNTEIQNERLKIEIAELGSKGMELYNELDSMMKLPNKTHEDSLKIISTYNILNNTFNNHQEYESQKD